MCLTSPFHPSSCTSPIDSSLKQSHNYQPSLSRAQDQACLPSQVADHIGHILSGRIQRTTSRAVRSQSQTRKKSNFKHLGRKHSLHTLRKCRIPLSTISRSILLRHVEEQMEEFLDLKREIDDDEEAIEEITDWLGELKGPDGGVGCALADVLEGLMDASLEEVDDGEEEKEDVLPLLSGHGDDFDQDDGLFDYYEDTLTAAAMETEWGPEEDDDLDAAWFPLPDDENPDEKEDFDGQDHAASPCRIQHLDREQSDVEQDLPDS